MQNFPGQPPSAPLVAPAIGQQAARTISQEVNKIDLELGKIIKDIARANGWDSTETIQVLESHGLSTATTFVKPLLAILNRSIDSPLRKLNTFQIQSLYASSDRKQQIVLDLLEESMLKGDSPKITTSIVTELLMIDKARKDAARMKEARPAVLTRDDYHLEAVRLRERVSELEAHIEAIGNAESDEEAKALILEVLK